VTVDKTIAGRLEGKSSLARLGLLVHVTGGYLDPGNSTTLTLEFHNVNNLPIKTLSWNENCSNVFYDYVERM